MCKKIIVEGWRVFINAEKTLKKDITAEMIGKLPLAGAQKSDSIIDTDKVKRKLNALACNNSINLNLARVPRERSSNEIYSGDSKPKRRRNRRRRYPGGTRTKTAEPRTAQTHQNQTESADSNGNHQIQQNEQEYDEQDEEEYEEGEEMGENGEEEMEEELEIAPARPISKNANSSPAILDITNDDDFLEEEEICWKPLPSNEPDENETNAPVEEEEILSEEELCERKRLVIIDAANVAYCHGKNKKYSAKGIVTCINYFKELNVEVLAFLPEHYTTSKPAVDGSITLAQFMPKVDDVPLIKQLEKQSLMVLTPPQVNFIFSFVFSSPI